MARIGIFSLIPFEGNVIRESLVARLLAEQGDDVTVVLCSGTQPRCIFDMAFARPSSKAGQCFNCFASTAARFNTWAGGAARQLPMGDLLTASALADTFARIDALPDDALFAFEHEGEPLGQWIRHALRIEYFGEHWEYLPERHAKGRAWLKSVVASMSAAARFIAEVQPDLLIVMNGVTACERGIKAVAGRLGVRCLYYEAGQRPDTLSFSDDSPACYYHYPEAWQQWAKRPLTVAEGLRLDGYLAHRRWRASSSDYVYSPSATGALAAVRDRLGLRDGASLVVAFSNMAGDTSVFDAQMAFLSQGDWLNACLTYATEHPEIDLVVRVHPAEVQTVLGRDGEAMAPRDLVASELRWRWPALPDNVKVVEPQTDVSSYDLLAMAQVVLVYVSTIGMEAAAMGLPVVSAGWTHYTGTGVSEEIHAKGALAAILDRLLAAPQPLPGAVEMARRYLYFWMFRAPFEQQLLVPPEHADPLSLWQWEAPRRRLVDYCHAVGPYILPPATWRPSDTDGLAVLAATPPVLLGSLDWQVPETFCQAFLPGLIAARSGVVLKVLLGDTPLALAVSKLAAALAPLGPPDSWPDIDLLPGDVTAEDLAPWLVLARGWLVADPGGLEGIMPLADAVGLRVLTPDSAPGELPALLAVRPDVAANRVPAPSILIAE